MYFKIKLNAFNIFSLPLAVSSLYVQHIFKQEAKKNVTEMVYNIREEMYKTLQSVDWMDNVTRCVSIVVSGISNGVFSVSSY